MLNRKVLLHSGKWDDLELKVVMKAQDLILSKFSTNVTCCSVVCHGKGNLGGDI